MLGAVAITAQGHVPAGEDKFKLVGAGLAEDGDGLAFPEATDVILQLLVPALVPVRVRHPKEDFAEQGLLVGRVEFAVNGGVCDFPVVLKAGPQKPAFLVHVIPVEANNLPLLFSQGIVKDLDQGFRRLLRFRGDRGKRHARSGQGSAAELEEFPPWQGLNKWITEWLTHDSLY